MASSNQQFNFFSLEATGRSRTLIAQTHQPGPYFYRGKEIPGLHGDTAISLDQAYVCVGGSRERIIYDLTDPALKPFAEKMENALEAFEKERAFELALTPPIDDADDDQQNNAQTASPLTPADFFDFLAQFVKSFFHTHSEQEIFALKEKYHLETGTVNENDLKYLPLSYAVQHGVGVCRHQVLLAIYLTLVYFKEENALSMQVYRLRESLRSIDPKDYDAKGQYRAGAPLFAHAVMVANFKNGQRFFVDAAHSFSLEISAVTEAKDLANLQDKFVKHYPGLNIGSFILFTNASYTNLARKQPKTILSAPKP